MTRLEIEMLMAAGELHKGVVLRYSTDPNRLDCLMQIRYITKESNGCFIFTGRPVVKDKGYYEIDERDWSVINERRIIRIEKNIAIFTRG